MKSGWAIKKLGEVCRPSNGLWKGKKGPFKNIAVLRSTNFTKDCLLNLDDVVYIDVESRLLPQKLLKEGDIIVEKSGGGPRQPVGRPVYFDKRCGEYSFCNFTSMLRVSDESVLPIYLHRCLYYLYVSGATEPLQSYTIGLRNLDFKGYLDLQIPVPSLSEQKRIVAKIDAAFENIDKLKANAERNLKNAKELFQSALDEAMRPKKGWVEKRLGEVGSCKNGLNFKRAAVGKSIDIVGVGDFKKGLFVDDATSLERLTLDELPDQGWYLQPNDIVFVRSNGSKALVGRAVIVKTKRPLTFSGFCIRFRIEDKNVNADFLSRIVSAERFRTTMLVDRNASTINNMTQPILLSQAIRFPSLAEQQQIVKRLDFLAEKVKLLEQNYTRQIADCAEMRQSVLCEAFEGRL